MRVCEGVGEQGSEGVRVSALQLVRESAPRVSIAGNNTYAVISWLSINIHTQALMCARKKMMRINFRSCSKSAKRLKQRSVGRVG